jgi:hypothetical protein
MCWNWLWKTEENKFDPDGFMNYVVNTGADGRLSQEGLFQSSDLQLRSMAANIIRFFKASPEQPNRLMFYCHGGLVSERVAGEGIKQQYQTFLDNGIYPVFFIWESTLLDALADELREIVNGRMYEMSAVENVVDEMVEEAAKLFPEPWTQMKLRGEQVFADHGGGWKFFKLLLKRLRKENMQVELHLVGHSAGSIVLATLLQQLLAGQAKAYPYVKIATCTLYAPACTINLFEETYVRAIDKFLLRRFFLFTLSDELEKEDSSVPLYNKSILYLVSRGFEAQHGDQPLLGMEIYAAKSLALANIVNSGRGAWLAVNRDHQPTWYLAKHGSIELKSSCSEHGCFSYDPDTLNSTLRIMLQLPELKKKFI